MNVVVNFIVLIIFVVSSLFQPASLANPYEKPRRKCVLCEHGINPDYKNVKLLSQFVSPYTGMLYGRHITGLCKEMHDRVEKQVKKSVMFGMKSQVKNIEK